MGRVTMIAQSHTYIIVRIMWPPLEQARPTHILGTRSVARNRSHLNVHMNDTSAIGASVEIHIERASSVRVSVQRVDVGGTDVKLIRWRLLAHVGSAKTTHRRRVHRTTACGPYFEPHCRPQTESEVAEQRRTSSGVYLNHNHVRITGSLRARVAAYKNRHVAVRLTLGYVAYLGEPRYSMFRLMRTTDNAPLHSATYWHHQDSQ